MFAIRARRMGLGRIAGGAVRSMSRITIFKPIVRSVHDTAKNETTKNTPQNVVQAQITSIAITVSGLLVATNEMIVHNNIIEPLLSEEFSAVCLCSKIVLWGVTQKIFIR